MTKSGWDIPQAPGTEIHLVGAVGLDEPDLGVCGVGRVRESAWPFRLWLSLLWLLWCDSSLLFGRRVLIRAPSGWTHANKTQRISPNDTNEAAATKK